MRFDLALFGLRLFKSRSQATLAIQDGAALLNDELVKPGHRVRPGDRITLIGRAGRRTCEVLGLPQKQVAVDACQLEHGLSPLAAERLHAFVDYVRALPVAERRRLRAGMSRAVARGKAFGNLVRTRTHGWRG